MTHAHLFLAQRDHGLVYWIPPASGMKLRLSLPAGTDRFIEQTLGHVQQPRLAIYCFSSLELIQYVDRFLLFKRIQIYITALRNILKFQIWLK